MMNLRISEELKKVFSKSLSYSTTKGLNEINTAVLSYFMVRELLYRDHISEQQSSLVVVESPISKEKVEIDLGFTTLRDKLMHMSAEDKINLEKKLLDYAGKSRPCEYNLGNKYPLSEELTGILSTAFLNVRYYNLYLNRTLPDRDVDEDKVPLVIEDIIAVIVADYDLFEENEDNKVVTIKNYLEEAGITYKDFEIYFDGVDIGGQIEEDESGEEPNDDDRPKDEKLTEDFMKFLNSLKDDPAVKSEEQNQDPKENKDSDRTEEEISEMSRAEEEFEKAGDRGAINVTPVDPNSKTPTLDQFAVNMTKLAAEGKYDPVVGREKEIEQIIEILCCRKKNNAVLTGDPGCGKSAIVEHLALKIVKNEVPLELRGKKIFSLDLNALVSGTQYRGQYEQRLQDVIKEVISNKNIIIFVDELHNLIGNGSAQGTGDGANILKPYLARGEFQCIGSTTTDEYRKYIEKDGALKRRFSSVLVEEPTVEQTVEILKGLSKVYGKFHNVTYSDEVLRKCAVWSGKYINDRFFPDKAISVMDMASSLAKLNYQKETYDPSILENLEKELSNLKQKKLDAIKDAEFEKAAVYRDQAKEIQKQIEAEKVREKEADPAEVRVSDVSSVIAKLSNVPIDTIMSSDLDKVRTMKAKMEEKIIGQSEAVKQLTLSLQRNIFGLRDPKKPIASFLLVGSTGTGKTLAAKLIAQEFMGSESNLITIACSEYMQDWAESKLLGSAPGYVGYSDSEPRLYVLKRKPYSVILIDEVEKSSSNLYNIWLNMLEEGEITLSSGEKVSCRNSIIIFTGNVGTKSLEMKGSGIGFVKLEGEEKRKSDEATVMKDVEKEFRPEFLNRLSKIIVFNSLGKEELDKIFWLELKKLQDRVKENQGYEIKVDDKIKDLIVSKCDPKYGARSLQRYITQYIEDNINNAFLEQDDIENKKNITLTLKEEEEVDVVFN